jgi:hypothetical protein
MGDRPRNSSWVRTSEDKVRRKDLCGSMRAVYVLEKLRDVSGPNLEEAERYSVHYLELPLFTPIMSIWILCTQDYFAHIHVRPFVIPTFLWENINNDTLNTSR